MFFARDFIQKKRDGVVLGDDEIRAFAQGIASQDVSDAQIAAFAMAVWFRGMTLREQTTLTQAMCDTGETLVWRDLPGPVLDKHSTGGVGDLVSLVLGPLVAACGGFVPMISGRGLGHTGGTLDKLESIPGFDTGRGVPEFQRMVRDNGVAIVGQTATLAPADLRMYAVRDVTATVGSTPLIVASILSKKFAEGLDALVMDIKFGTGAFVPDAVRAGRLARRICRVSGSANLPCSALLTDMNQPLASSAGNSVEVMEAIRFLRGEVRDSRLFEVVLSLCSELLLLGRLAESDSRARELTIAALESGQAAERFARMVRAQGGPSDLFDDPTALLPRAPVERPVFAAESGYVSTMDTNAIGSAVVLLGGGRRRVGDSIDHAVGLTAIIRIGELADRQRPLAVVHARDEDQWQRAAGAVRAAVTLEKEPVSCPAPVAGTVREGGSDGNG